VARDRDPGNRQQTVAAAPTIAAIRRGDLHWIAPVDAHGPAPSYAHPHVVVQDDVFNDSRITTVVVCALTTNLKRATEPGNVLLEVGEGDLPQHSVVVDADALALAWALCGALTMQVTRWAVFEELDEHALAASLRATAKTMVPASRGRRG